MSAAWKSLREAALILASQDPIKQRLVESFSKHLLELQADSLPETLRPAFRRLCERMTGITPMRGETAVAATVRKMSNEDAAACARQIVELALEVDRQRAPVARVRSRPLVQVYPAETVEVQVSRA